MRFLKRNLHTLYESFIAYQAPVNLSYNWNFGIYALALLGVQILSGIFLVMFYSAHVDVAFLSVERIMRDVPYGWFLRYIHANGASFFFIVVYAHLFRGMFYGSYLYPRRLLWSTGVLILLLMIITAFLGYILPWGQMSYWGATVITNLATTIPFFGQLIVQWLWGGFSVDNVTLTKFFALHYLFPFIILGLVGIHLALLHRTGSSNPIGIRSHIDDIPFHPYFTVKDFFSIFPFSFLFLLFVFFLPNYLGHPDNYIPANPDLTPEHIVPEWYFLPFYAILRSIPDKLFGVLALLASIVTLFLLPFLSAPAMRNSHFRPLSQFLLLCFFADTVLLGYLGQSPVEEPFLSLAQGATLLYFLYFLVVFLSKTTALRGALAGGLVEQAAGSAPLSEKAVLFVGLGAAVWFTVYSINHLLPASKFSMPLPQVDLNNPVLRDTMERLRNHSSHKFPTPPLPPAPPAALPVDPAQAEFIDRAQTMVDSRPWITMGNLMAPHHDPVLPFQGGKSLISVFFRHDVELLQCLWNVIHTRGLGYVHALTPTSFVDMAVNLSQYSESLRDMMLTTMALTEIAIRDQVLLLTMSPYLDQTTAFLANLPF